MDHPTTALVPLRALGAGKSRLSHMLTPTQRGMLAEAMFVDVVDALAASTVAEVVVAAGDDATAALARSLGLAVITDPPGQHSLDLALASAHALMGSRASLLVVTADLPTVTPDELDEVVRTDSPVVVAPTHDGGTGALLRRPSDAFVPAYGAGSSRRHTDLAARAGYDHRTVLLPGFQRDVDTWEDVLDLATATPGRRTSAVLPTLFDSAADVG